MRLAERRTPRCVRRSSGRRSELLERELDPALVSTAVAKLDLDVPVHEAGADRALCIAATPVVCEGGSEPTTEVPVGSGPRKPVFVRATACDLARFGPVDVLCGGRTLDDIELRRNDLAYLDALGARAIPDPTTAGDFCRRFGELDNGEAQR